MTDRYAEICRSHWQKYESDDEHADRVERCTKEANKYFAPAVAPALNDYHQALRDIAPYKNSPRWERMRDQARRDWDTATAPAHELFLRTFEDLMRDGEVSDATGQAWDNLAKQGVEERSAA